VCVCVCVCVSYGERNVRDTITLSHNDDCMCPSVCLSRAENVVVGTNVILTSLQQHARINDCTIQ